MGMRHESLFVLNNVTKTFTNGKESFNALSNVSINLPSKGLVSITGKSGSGKSTLLNILGCIEKPTEGKVLYLNKDISKLSDKEFSSYHLNEISIIFQHYNLFDDLSAIDNVMLPLLMRGESKSVAYEKAEALFRKFYIHDLMNQKTKLLSGGEKQRVAILRSLITDPKAILCDEPTGALDHRNGTAIMEIFKDISKDKLVLMVSHNFEFVKAYSDRIILFKDGKVVSDTTINECEETKYRLRKTNKYSSKWNNSFLKLNLKRNIKKSILSVLSCTIGFAAILLAFGFSNGSETSQKNALTSNLAISYSTASLTSYYELENSPLSFKKEVKPDDIVTDYYLSSFEDVVYKPNLSYFFSSYPIGRYGDEEISGFEMIPVLNESLVEFGKPLLVSGELSIDTLTDVVVNEEFLKLLNLSSDKAVDDLFKITNSVTVSYQTGDKENPIVKDEYSYNFKLRIAGVVKEFAFLNTPKIYYSYDAIYEELENTFAENISEHLKKSVSFLSLIENASEDDVITGYSTLLFLTSNKEKDKFFSYIETLQNEEDEFQITSNAYEIQKSYSTFISSFSNALFLFVIIAFIGINLIIGMISLSSFIQNKKESAIMTCLGARTSSIISIYLSENLFLCFISIVLSVVLAILTQGILNKIISERFALDNLIDIPFMNFMNIPFGLIIILFVIACLCVSLFTLTPLLIYKRISLADELRDE